MEKGPAVVHDDVRYTPATRMSPETSPGWEQAKAAATWAPAPRPASNTRVWSMHSCAAWSRMICSTSAASSGPSDEPVTFH